MGLDPHETVVLEDSVAGVFRSLLSVRTRPTIGGGKPYRVLVGLS